VISISDITTVKRVLTVHHALQGGWYAQEHLREALAEKYPTYGFYNSYEEIKITVKPGDKFNHDWFGEAIETAEAHGKIKNAEFEADMKRQDEQQEILEKELNELGQKPRLRWSVSGVELTDIAFEGKITFWHWVTMEGSYEETEVCSEEFLNPTWRDVAIAFNDVITGTDVYDHMFLEGICVEKRTGKGRFSVGS
jgi:hypothetical protein